MARIMKKENNECQSQSKCSNRAGQCTRRPERVVRGGCEGVSFQSVSLGIVEAGAVAVGDGGGGGRGIDGVGNDKHGDLSVSRYATFNLSRLTVSCLPSMSSV